MSDRPRLLFVSPRFLFPSNTGGQIRTSQVLRGMKNGSFHITLVSPVPAGAESQFRSELAGLSDRFRGWSAPGRAPWTRFTRMRHMLSSIPIPVMTDRSREGASIVREELSEEPDIVVFDFVHSVILAPEELGVPSVVFTHNVETEIFERHAEVARNPVGRWIWRDQSRKMASFEGRSLSRFDAVVAVSERDRRAFAERYGLKEVDVIRTGVDLDSYTFDANRLGANVVFVGSMDWMANVDAMTFFMDDVWSDIIREHPDASMTVVGRNPPPGLVDRCRRKQLNWTFTGFVDDIGPYLKAATVSVVPLRVGGGTRMKVFESAASGIPLVSTSVGVEGLPLESDVHFLCADTAGELARAVVALLRDAEARRRLSLAAREFVVENFSSQGAADDFEAICLKTLTAARR